MQVGTTISEDDLPYGLPEKLKDWDKITVSKEDAQDMATNGLPINYSGSGEGHSAAVRSRC